MKGACNRECCLDNQILPKTDYNSSRILSVSNFGNFSNFPLTLEALATVCALTPTALGVGSSNFQKEENGGSEVLVSGEKHKIPPENYRRRGYCFWSIFTFRGHFDKAAILDFGQRKN